MPPNDGETHLFRDLGFVSWAQPEFVRVGFCTTGSTGLAVIWFGSVLFGLN